MLCVFKRNDIYIKKTLINNITKLTVFMFRVKLKLRQLLLKLVACASSLSIGTEYHDQGSATCLCITTQKLPFVK